MGWKRRVPGEAYHQKKFSALFVFFIAQITIESHLHLFSQLVLIVPSTRMSALLGCTAFFTKSSHTIWHRVKDSKYIICEVNEGTNKQIISFLDVMAFELHRQRLCSGSWQNTLGSPKEHAMLAVLGLHHAEVSGGG